MKTSASKIEDRCRGAIDHTITSKHATHPVPNLGVRLWGERLEEAYHTHTLASSCDTIG